MDYSVATMNLVGQCNQKQKACVQQVMKRTKHQEPNIHQPTVALRVKENEGETHK